MSDDAFAELVGVTDEDAALGPIDMLLAASRSGNPFVLVLLDANMPDMDGFGVAERIAAQRELAGSTIMMLTSSGQHGDAGRFRAAHPAATGLPGPRAAPGRRRAGRSGRRGAG